MYFNFLSGIFPETLGLNNRNRIVYQYYPTVKVFTYNNHLQEFLSGINDVTNFQIGNPLNIFQIA